MHLELHLPGRRRTSTSARPRTARAPAAQTETNGCDSGSLPIGTAGRGQRRQPARDAGLQLVADDAGMGETDPDACQYNDFALVKLDPADVGSVNPSVPGFGGPTGLGSSAAGLGDTVYTLRELVAARGVTTAEPEAGHRRPGRGQRLEPHRLHGDPGRSRATRAADSWTTTGKAIGVLSTLQIAPIPASNGVGDLRHELDYLHAHSSFGGVNLVNGTEPFNAEPGRRDPRRLARRHLRTIRPVPRAGRVAPRRRRCRSRARRRCPR